MRLTYAKKMAMRMSPSTRLNTNGLLNVSSKYFTTARGMTTNRPTARAIATVKVSASSFQPREDGSAAPSTGSPVPGSGCRLLLEAVVRRQAQSADAQRERLHQHPHATHHRRLQHRIPPGEGHQRERVTGDVARRPAHRESPRVLAPHHHAFQHGLAADGIDGVVVVGAVRSLARTRTPAVPAATRPRARLRPAVRTTSAQRGSTFAILRLPWLIRARPPTWTGCRPAAPRDTGGTEPDTTPWRPP